MAAAASFSGMPQVLVALLSCRVLVAELARDGREERVGFRGGFLLIESVCKRRSQPYSSYW